MLTRRFFEFVVGLFMIAGIVAVFMLAFKASGLSQYSSRDSFYVTALFDNVGDLKIRAPVTIAGVRVGEVKKITIDPSTFRAHVAIFIDKKQKSIPVDSSASILTAGLIGANYISITPGFSDENLTDGSVINETHSALILENLIGEVVYQLKGDKNKEKDNDKKNGKQEDTN